MKQILTTVITIVFSCLWINSALAYDCSTLQEWNSHKPYHNGDEVQYNADAYQANATTRGEQPDGGYPWEFIESCDAGGGDGGDGGGGGDSQPLSIYGVWHCGNHYCDWSLVRDTSPGGEFDQANHWIIDRGDGRPSVNLVVLSFLEPLELLLQTTNEAFVNGIPRGMTQGVVNYFKNEGIRVMLSMGGVTYTQSWNIALTTDAVQLAMLASQAVATLGADGLEIDWENGTPDVDELDGIETFIDTYNANSGTLLTLDLAVGDRYLQELSRRAAADWLPNSKIDYINAMVPRGEPSTDQWQEHVDGKANYNPVILPKAPAKIVVSLWLTDGKWPNENCVDFASSSQLAKADYVQTVEPNGAGTTPGFLGYMFWAAECPSTRNACTTPPDTCEDGMGAGATHFNIPIPIGTLRQD
jgi:hypothetical protein